MSANDLFLGIEFLTMVQTSFQDLDESIVSRFITSFALVKLNQTLGALAIIPPNVTLTITDESIPTYFFLYNSIDLTSHQEYIRQ